MDNPLVTPESVRRLTRDERMAAAYLGEKEVRYLVDTYYQLQDFRIAARNQERSLSESGEPNGTITWMANQAETLELQIKGALGKFAESKQDGQWLLSNHGIGPVISAGLIAHLTLKPTVGHWWSYAGLLPYQRKKRGEKLTWNPDLRRLCWLIGESFVRFHKSPKCFYGHQWAARKAYEQAKNEAGEYAEAARYELENKKYAADTETKKKLESGRLSDAHIHARSKRWTVKLFLSHYHHVRHVVETGREPPRPYILTEEGGHAHYVGPPNWP